MQELDKPSVTLPRTQSMESVEEGPSKNKGKKKEKRIRSHTNSGAPPPTEYAFLKSLLLMMGEIMH